MMRFEFATATRIIFGQGTVNEVPRFASKMGNCAMLVTGRNVDRALGLLKGLRKTGMKAFVFSVSGEPTVNLIIEGIQAARQNACQIVMGMGGGSAIDTAKAIAALLTNKGDIIDYLEVIGQGKPLTNAPAPCIAIPTTAGSGAEVTKNSVLTSLQHKIKVSLRSPMMLPDLAVIDPELTYSMPPEITASTGLDALTQILESFVSVESNPLTDALCLDGLKRAARSLPRAFEDGSNVKAREDMALVSLYGGLALANSKLGAVHGFAGPMGAMFPAPHGVICARLLPFVMEVNVKVLQRHSSQQFLYRYDEVAKVLTGKSGARAEEGTAWIYDLCETLDIPVLANYGITEDHFSELVAKSKKASSMKGNPVMLTDEELTDILKRAVS
ncbi:MAG: iron-containing alcohol dehydrogenase [Desulfobacterales bacterium]|nr:MAG: iron-containing alcohol dehydrogenase [Desulfobacterales bacterium]UCD90686.1 MAG: iron-containing alcohol dehydrogenase [Desulfobacterales bacterium]